jgi:single-strand DNA-binding protein
MSYDLTGKVKLIQDAQTFGSGFTKREMVVVVEDGKYPQEINMEFVQDKVSLLDNVQVGQEVTVTFDIRGREYNDRYFNNLQGWKIQAGEKVDAAPADAEGKPPVLDKGVQSDFTEEYEEEIPF